MIDRGQTNFLKLPAIWFQSSGSASLRPGCCETTAATESGEVVHESCNCEFWNKTKKTKIEIYWNVGWLYYYSAHI